jgi:hypothetical protein
MARLAAAVLAAVAAASLAACSSVVGGQGQAAPRSPSASAAPPSPAARRLAGLLMDPPPGSQAGSTLWARTRIPTVRQFVIWDYGDRLVDREVALLRDQGLQYVAHQYWLAVDGNAADMVLMQFSSPQGARVRFDFATEARRTVPGMRRLGVPHLPGAVGYYRPTPDQLGKVVAIVYARVGRYVVEEFYYSSGQLHPADAVAWLRAQVRRLR